MRQHIDTLAVVFMAWGAFQLLLALIMGGLLLGLGVFVAVSAVDTDAVAMGVIWAVAGVVAGGVTGLIAVAWAVVGSGIRRRRPWARLAGFAMGALALTSVPIGTLVGIYAFMTLMDTDVAMEFEMGGNS